MHESVHRGRDNNSFNRFQKQRKNKGKRRTNIEQENSHQKQKQCKRNILTTSIIIYEQKNKVSRPTSGGNTRNVPKHQGTKCGQYNQQKEQHTNHTIKIQRERKKTQCLTGKSNYIFLVPKQQVDLGERREKQPKPVVTITQNHNEKNVFTKCDQTLKPKRKL